MNIFETIFPQFSKTSRRKIPEPFVYYFIKPCAFVVASGGCLLPIKTKEMSRPPYYMTGKGGELMLAPNCFISAANYAKSVFITHTSHNINRFKIPRKLTILGNQVPNNLDSTSESV